MRVLVLTNHFAEFYGSEIVALEVAEWFQAQGDHVTLGANYISEPMRSAAPGGLVLTKKLEEIELNNFDLVWCQHDMLALLPLQAFERTVGEQRLPRFACVSLSPYEPYEHIDVLLAIALSARVYVNSPETRLEVARRGHGTIDVNDIHVFHNAAPPAFWAASQPPIYKRGSNPESIAVISNHVPEELNLALGDLGRAGITIHRLGLGHDYCRVRPADVCSVGAVVSIGKSVVYAVAANKPVYMYDRNGGDGWLTRANFKNSLDHNFSGRPVRRCLSRSEIAREILDGFANATVEVSRLGEIADLTLFQLDHYLRPLRQQALDQAFARHAAQQLAAHLKRPWIRAHMETAREKSLVMKRLYVARHSAPR